MKLNKSVTLPLAGVSFPLRERGLKLDYLCQDKIQTLVVPLAGTWIETFPGGDGGSKGRSFPLRERGLKLSNPVYRYIPVIVVPLAGTWIETRM